MKQLLVIVFLCTGGLCFGRGLAYVDRDHPIILEGFYNSTHPGGRYNPGIPGFPFSIAYKSGSSGGAKLIYPVYKRIYMNVFIMGTAFHLDKTDINSVIAEHYKDDNYYIGIKGQNTDPMFEMFLLTAGPGYKVHTKVIDIYTYINAGWGISGVGFSSYIERKRKNESYSEEITFGPKYENEHNFFCYMAGVTIERKIIPNLYVTAGGSYISGQAAVPFKEYRQTFIDERTATDYPGKINHLNLLQLQMGLQLRLWRPTRHTSQTK